MASDLWSAVTLYNGSLQKKKEELESFVTDMQKYMNGSDHNNFFVRLNEDFFKISDIHLFSTVNQFLITI